MWIHNFSQILISIVLIFQFEGCNSNTSKDSPSKGNVIGNSAVTPNITKEKPITKFSIDHGPSHQSVSKAVELFKKACPEIINNWSRVTSADARFAPVYDTQLGWRKGIHLNIVYNGENLPFWMSSGKKPGILTSKSNGLKMCRIPNDLDGGSRGWKPLPEMAGIMKEEWESRVDQARKKEPVLTLEQIYGALSIIYHESKKKMSKKRGTSKCQNSEDYYLGRLEEIYLSAVGYEPQKSKNLSDFALSMFGCVSCNKDVSKTSCTKARKLMRKAKL